MASVFKQSFLHNKKVTLAGAMPRRQQNLIVAWAELRYAELLENWQRAQDEQALRSIKGLE